MHTIRSHRPAHDPSDHYVLEFHDSLSWQLRKRCVRDAADIVQAEVAGLLPKVASVAARYPDPRKYARIRAGAAISNHFRADKTQRGQGSRAHINDDGELADGRVVLSGQSPVAWSDGEVTLYDTIPADGPDPIEELVSNLHHRELLDRALLDVNPETRRILGWAHVLDFSDSEIAQHLGCARETANRKKTAAVRQIRGQLGPHTA